jgi:hypothetical protein
VIAVQTIDERVVTTSMRMVVASRHKSYGRIMTMSANTKPAANLELRPLEDHELEMAHAVDAIDQALSEVGLTWSWLAQIVAAGVVRHAQRHGGACRRVLPPTVFDLSSFFAEWARNSKVGARVIVRADRGKCSATSGAGPVDATVA